ncbi:hypothetical protein EUGRSUZ_A02833 [Eucalyptus grandis]|uniref:Uncharacterized protein n=2 Tax=Eucalyptus grandis TaxID=71139 RepID=A0A059DK53_EUCGR|nr:hypothetical protein EUGRSUZ_A02833 [Eucalyptus grandis]
MSSSSYNTPSSECNFFSFPDIISSDSTSWNASAALAAAFCMSLVLGDAGTGSRHAESAKLRQADWPLSASAATSCALAAMSAVGKVPSQILDFFLGSRTSQTHFPESRSRTPRYTGWRVSRNFFLPAGFFGWSDARRTSSPEKFPGAALRSWDSSNERGGSAKSKLKELGWEI